MRRDQVGGALVTQMSEVIAQQSAAQGMDSTVVSAILRHESAATERRALTLWPSMQPGLVANALESEQNLVMGIAGRSASIGPGQMQV